MADTELQSAGAGTESSHTVTIENIHQAVLDTVAKAFPLFKTVAEDAPLVTDTGDATGKLPYAAPACIVSMPLFESKKPECADLLPVDLHFELRIVGAYSGEGADRKTRQLAGALAQCIEGNRFGLPMRGAEFVRAKADTTLPALHHLCPWLIEFTLSVYLGTEEGDDFTMPEKVYVSMAPEVGLAHIDKYKLLG